ncbi:MAG: transposase [Rhizonema sp. PD37]|nr:transposase [Rhizonema sp. PD37]
MQLAYKFKLQPSNQQVELLEDWQHKVGYAQNRSLGDRIATYNNTFVEGDYCDLYTKREISSQYLYCDLETKALTSSLHCSVNKSTSLGHPWRDDNPKLRRAKPGKDGKVKPFEPKRSAYEMHSNWLTQLKLEKPEYKSVNADVLQQSLRHVDSAFNKFFSGKAGFPNFKQHFDVGFEFKSGTVKIDGNYITFPTLGTMRFFKSRNIPNSWEIRTTTVSRDADGWYVSVLLRDETVPDLLIKTFDQCKTIQGADVGIKKLVALSDGTMLDNPQFLKRSERTLSIRQRRVSRKQKGSNNRKTAAKQLARTHQKIRRQREDNLWKSAKKIASNADVTVFEDLNIKGMKARCKPKVDPETGKYFKNGQSAKAALNKAISDASWYSLRQKTEHQASKLGNLVIGVDPKYSSQECSECHHISSGNRDQEKFICEECGHSDDADTNGAVNHAHRGKQKLGIDSLRVVSAKVTPLEPASQEASSVLREEPRNPANSTLKQRQLLLVLFYCTSPLSKPQAKSQRKALSVEYTQLTLFDDFDWDAEKSTS